jgi:sulfite exporter TauE/SafE
MYYVAFVAGLMGSLHCAGMCGPIALALPYKGSIIWLYHLGRIMSYSLVGALFGYAGEGLIFVGFQQWVSIGAGLLMLLFLWMPRKGWGWVEIWNQQLFWLFGQFLGRRDAKAAWAVGVLNGFLPCGLVYTAALGAISLAHIWQGSVFMACFGLGTVPMMAALSGKHKFLSPQMRQYFRKSVPVFVSALACLLILRGMGLGIPFLSPEFAQSSSSCH